MLGSVPEPAGDGPPGAVMSGDRGGGGTGWGRRQSRCLAEGAAASAAAFAVYVGYVRKSHQNALFSLKTTLV